MMREFEKYAIPEIPDFFEKIRTATARKMLILKQHPAIFDFLKSMYLEKDEEVYGEIQYFLQHSTEYRERFAWDNVDNSKFKENIDAAILRRLLMWAGEGMAQSMTMETEIKDMDGLLRDFYDCLDFMKQNFYKEEYL